jgi:hypothetical protein
VRKLPRLFDRVLRRHVLTIPPGCAIYGDRLRFRPVVDVSTPERNRT